MKKSKKILTTEIKYDKDKLYFCKSNKKGFIEIFETKRTKGRKKGQVNNKKIKEDMYF